MKKLKVSWFCVVVCTLIFFYGCSSVITSDSTLNSPEKPKPKKYSKYSKYQKDYKSSSYARESKDNEYNNDSNGCRPYQVFGQWYQPLSDARGFKERGIASWYGEQFHGKRTSSGDIFDMHMISAAHKILPLGTYVRVRNLENGKELDMIINDRGPFISGRVIDLSKAAARELGIFDPGTAWVDVIALGQLTASNGNTRTYVPVNYSKGIFTIQVGAFRDKTKAEKLMRELHQSHGNAQVKSSYSHANGELLHRVLVGKCTDLEQAGKYEVILRKNGFNDAFLVAD